MTMGRLSEWPRRGTLATTEPGRWIEVRNFLFESVETRCRAVGIREGDVLQCLDNEPRGIILRDALGYRRTLERPYAWFVGTRRKDCENGEGLGLELPADHSAEKA